MDEARARRLLEDERARVQDALDAAATAARDDRSDQQQTGDIADPAEALTDQKTADELVAQLHGRLAAIGRAEERLAAGTYGRSVRSGRPIPDDRLEADPAAELTVDEAR